MAKKSDGCSTLLGLGFIVLIFGGAIKGCSGGGNSAPTPASSYASPSSSSVQNQAFAPVLPPPTDKDGAAIPNPESYVPKTVTLRQAVEIKLPGGLRTKTIPAGTELNVKGVYGYKVMVEGNGRVEFVPAASTDLLDQMVKATGQ